MVLEIRINIAGSLHVCHWLSPQRSVGVPAWNVDRNRPTREEKM
jgi:hypothetical protein